MPIRIFVSTVLLALAVQPAAAGPIQGVIDSITGSAEVRSIAGEILVVFDAPSELLRPEFRDRPGIGIQIFPLPEFREQIFVVDPFNDVDGEIRLGEVFLPGLSIAQLSRISFASQASFTAEIFRPTPTFVGSSADIPGGQAGFYVVAVPEPSSIAVAGLAAAGLAIRRRR